MRKGQLTVGSFLCFMGSVNPSVFFNQFWFHESKNILDGSRINAEQGSRSISLIRCHTSFSKWNFQSSTTKRLRLSGDPVWMFWGPCFFKSVLGQFASNSPHFVNTCCLFIYFYFHFVLLCTHRQIFALILQVLTKLRIFINCEKSHTPFFFFTVTVVLILLWTSCLLCNMWNRLRFPHSAQFCW